MMCAPDSIPKIAQASDAGKRSFTFPPIIFSMNDFREKPKSNGRFHVVNRSNSPSNRKFCSGVFPKPIPGSKTICSGGNSRSVQPLFIRSLKNSSYFSNNIPLSFRFSWSVGGACMQM